MGYIASLLSKWCLAEVTGGSPGRGWEWKASLEDSVGTVNRWAGQGTYHSSQTRLQARTPAGPGSLAGREVSKAGLYG